jgi:hypothetical protein
MRTLIACCAAALALTGCSGDDTSADGGTTAGESGATTQADSVDDGSTALPMESDSSSGGSTAAADSSSDGGESSTGADETSSSTGTPCPAGTEGCPCDAGACEGELQCTAEVCVPAGACAEHVDAEPNDSEATAVDLGEVAGCAVAEVNGSIDEGDDDWYVYHGTHDELCNMDTSGIVTADVDLDVCMFWECDQGNEQVVCFGTPEAISPEGRLGCCGSASSVVFMQRNCLGAGNELDGTIYLQMRDPGEPVCIDYALAYIF